MIILMYKTLYMMKNNLWNIFTIGTFKIGFLYFDLKLNSLNTFKTYGLGISYRDDKVGHSS